MSRKNQAKDKLRVYRPGTLQLGGYRDVQNSQQRFNPSNPKKARSKLPLALVIFLVLAGTLYFLNGDGKTVTYRSSTGKDLASTSIRPVSFNACNGNATPKLLIVVLQKQHLWACDYSQSVFNSPVVTGYTKNPADVTPTGTYAIYGKVRNTRLTGSDGTTTWNDPVSYWMPFLYNKYGAYGLHDATWRKPPEFGHVSTSSPNASHGCVELPLATAKWIYSWAKIGTKISIENA